MKSVGMEGKDRENTSLRDYVELWAGRWRQTGLCYLINIRNEYPHSQKSEPKLCPLCCTEHLEQVWEPYLGFTKVLYGVCAHAFLKKLIECELEFCMSCSGGDPEIYLPPRFHVQSGWVVLSLTWYSGQRVKYPLSIYLVCQVSVYVVLCSFIFMKYLESLLYYQYVCYEVVFLLYLERPDNSHLFCIKLS